MFVLVIDVDRYDKCCRIFTFLVNTRWSMCFYLGLHHLQPTSFLILYMFRAIDKHEEVCNQQIALIKKENTPTWFIYCLQQSTGSINT